MGSDSWLYSYDDNGNMTGKTNGADTWTYSWNDENRLVRVQGPGSVDVAYSYDSMGRMLTRDDGTLTTLVWDNWDCIKEVTGLSETVYHIPEGQILSFIRDGVAYQAHSDALGSVRMITDEAGEVVARYEYDAFGTAISVMEDPALVGFPMRFVGSQGVRHDSVTNFHYMRCRWYMTGLERFISRDPVGLTSGLSRYHYAANNPINLIDPLGLKPATTKAKYEAFYQRWSKKYRVGEFDGVEALVPKRGDSQGLDIFCKQLGELSDCADSNLEFATLVQAVYLPTSAATRYKPYERYFFETSNLQDAKHYAIAPGMKNWQFAYQDNAGPAGATPKKCKPKKCTVPV